MSLHKTKPSLPTLQGDRFRATHQASVDAVLGTNVRKVFSRGSRFYNHDLWTLRAFVVALCSWASRNAGQTPTLRDVTEMCREASSKPVYDPHIVIAATPEKLKLAVALALIGGAYHEAWHTKYSKRTPLDPRAMHKLITDVWGRVDDWSKLSQTILQWQNVVDDIFIERNGCQDFPGAEPKMQDLQHFILDQEEEGRNPKKLAGATGQDLFPTLMAVSATFRDVGLGYNTERQRRALAEYREHNPDAVDYVLSGPLADLLRRTIALGPTENIETLRLALEIVATIKETSEEQPEESDPEDGEGEGQSQDAPRCPNCGSTKIKMVVFKGGKRGKLVCEDCRYEEEMDLPEQPKDGKGSGQGVKAEYEDENDRPDSGDSDGEGSSEDGDEGDSKDKKDKGSKGGSEDGEDEDGSGSDDGDEDDESDGDSKGSKGDEDGDEDGEGSTGSDGDDEGQDGDDSGSEGKDGQDDGQGSDGSESDGEGQDKNSDAGDAQEGGTGAGGHHHDKGPAKAWDVVAQELLEAAENGEENGLLDNNSALEGAVEEQREEEDADCRGNEAAYRPYDPSLDAVDYVGPSNRGQGNDERRANEMLEGVRTETAYLRARLRNIVRSVMQTAVEHGVRRGRGLSERQFVDDVCCLRGGRMPDRPDYDQEDEIDTSSAVAVVLDESGSMSRRLQLATQALMAITEPFDFLNCPTMAIGFRDGGRYADTSDGDEDGFFRADSSQIDVFKGFHESFRSVKWRFANTRATGGTPMANGIQYALEALNERPETHRIMFVVTDGHPNYNHVPVINRQLRLAREAGIYTIGVGIGSGAEYVNRLFDDAVYVPSMNGLASALIQKLNEIMDFRGQRRGGRRLPSAS